MSLAGGVTSAIRIPRRDRQMLAALRLRAAPARTARRWCTCCRARSWRSPAAKKSPTFRTIYVLATPRRNELLDAKREDELDEIVAEARRVMAETMNDGPA